MKIVIDLDGTICSEEKQFSRSLAMPITGAPESLRALKAEGHVIIIYSARTWAEYEVTVEWLKVHDIPYDQIILGKPQGDFWIDDRAIEFKSWDSVRSRLK